MNGLIQFVKPALDLVSALHGGEYEKFGQGILALILVALTFSGIAKAISSGVRSLSEHHMVPIYRALRALFGWLLPCGASFAKWIWVGKARDPERLRALTLWGKAKAWLIVAIASVYCLYFSFLGISVETLATIKIMSIPIEIYAQGMGWGTLSLVLARSFFNDIRYNWPLV